MNHPRMEWTIHIDGGPRRVNHAAVCVGERIFSFGGYCTGDNYKDQTPIDVFVLDTRTYRWVEVPKPKSYDEEPESLEDMDEIFNWPYQRYGHTVSAHGKYVYLFGGRNDNYPCNNLYVFDTQTYKWSRPSVTGDIPAARDGHSSCVIDNNMYIFGGYEETNFRFGLDVYRLNLTTMHWSLLHCKGEPPAYRDFHSATAIGDCMYIFGGRCDNGQWPGAGQSTEYYPDSVSYLDIKQNRWITPDIQAPYPSGRRSHSAICLNNTLLIFGGYNGTNNEHKSDMWQLDPDSMRWTQIKPRGKGPEPRRRQALCQVGNKLFLFGGTSPYTGPPIIFTQEQLNLMPDQEETMDKLMDHADMFVLDLNPSLKTLCLLKVVELSNKSKDYSNELPRDLVMEIANMTSNNSISKPLRTMPSVGPTG